MGDRIELVEKDARVNALVAAEKNGGGGVEAGPSHGLRHIVVSFLCVVTV
jgi:hypothetical protein